MRVFCLVVGLLGAVAALPASAEPEPGTSALNFAVMRNGQQIGTSTLRVSKNGAETIAEMRTHIRIGFGGFTFYQFEQTESERWADGRLVEMKSVTNDNGTPHRVNAMRRGESLVVEADGKRKEVDPNVVPVSLWNPTALAQRIAINPNDGTLSRLSVTDHGKEELVLKGRPTPARHYRIETSFAQDVWYDDNDRLVRIELRGSDGSKIHYQLG